MSPAPPVVKVWPRTGPTLHLKTMGVKEALRSKLGGGGRRGGGGFKYLVSAMISSIVVVFAQRRRASFTSRELMLTSLIVACSTATQTYTVVNKGAYQRQGRHPCSIMVWGEGSVCVNDLHHHHVTQRSPEHLHSPKEQLLTTVLKCSVVLCSLHNIAESSLLPPHPSFNCSNTPLTSELFLTERTHMHSAHTTKSTISLTFTLGNACVKTDAMSPGN